MLACLWQAVPRAGLEAGWQGWLAAAGEWGRGRPLSSLLTATHCLSPLCLSGRAGQQGPACHCPLAPACLLLATLLLPLSSSSLIINMPVTLGLHSSPGYSPKGRSRKHLPSLSQTGKIYPKTHTLHCPCALCLPACHMCPFCTCCMAFKANTSSSSLYLYLSKHCVCFS